MEPKSRTRNAAILSAAAAILAGCAADVSRGDSHPRPLRIETPELSTTMEDDFPRDAVPEDPSERAVFEQINRDRRRERVAPVLWDEKAAALARAYTRQQIVDGTIGHFLLDGVPPYARLSKNSDLGTGSENAAAYMTTSGHLWDSPKDLGLLGEREMLNEKPPEDGHRRAILDPLATHVGVGLALAGGEFRLVEEFTTRGFDWLRIARVGPGGASIRVRGKALDGRTIGFVSVARQPAPKPITREQANARRSYSYPDPNWALMPAASSLTAVGLKTYHCLVPSVRGKFSFEYEIDTPGLWTFVLYFDQKGRPDSYAGGSFSLWVGRDA